MYTELSGKVVVISGAGGGLGLAVARRFHAEGGRMVLIDRSLEALRTTCAAIGLAEADALLSVTDLTHPDAVTQAVQNAVARFGGIDILANIAGAFVFSGPTYQADPDDLDKMLTINVKTVFLLSAAIARIMVEKATPGRIINVGASAALEGQAGLAAYSASKAALLRLTESMAAELREQKITVNAILPSTIDTPANRKAMPDADAGKWVTPDSLADVIAFLASDAARDISGASIPVYGRA